MGQMTDRDLSASPRRMTERKKGLRSKKRREDSVIDRTTRALKALHESGDFPVGWGVVGYHPTYTVKEIASVVAQCDPGIREYVRTFMENGFETCQSCEGVAYDALKKTWGSGHCYPEPTVEFFGGPSEGPRAVALCLERALPLAELRRVWSMQDGEAVGPHWAVTFSRKGHD